MRVSHHEYLGFYPSGTGSAIDVPTGGLVQQFLADSGQTLLTGQVVYCSDAQEVSTSATQATVGAKYVGVVVGGQSLNDDIPLDLTGVTNSISLTAATAGQRVLVQVAGVVTVIGGAAVTAGALLMGDSTAGRVITATGAAQYLLGVGVTDCSGANAGLKMLIRHFYIP